MVGDNGKTNDVIFCGERKPAKRNVIFFSGDVQVFYIQLNSPITTKITD